MLGITTLVTHIQQNLLFFFHCRVVVLLLPSLQTVRLTDD